MSGAYRLEIPTRWMDGDPYGHVNNAEYYSFFDTALTTWLVKDAGVDPANAPSIGLCVESKCTFQAPLSFPESVTAKVCAAKVTRSSVRYEIDLFTEDGTHAAHGYFVHVQVDRRTRKAVPLPERLRERLEEITAAAPEALEPAAEDGGGASPRQLQRRNS